MTDKINTAGATCPLIKGKTFDDYHEFCLVCLNCPFNPCIEDRRNKKLTRMELGRLVGTKTFRRLGREGMRELGRKGGLATARKYDKHAEWGRQGGRAYALTFADIRQQQPLEKEVMDTSDNLKELKRLYRLRHRSNGRKQIQEGLGVTSSSPVPEGVSN